MKAVSITYKELFRRFDFSKTGANPYYITEGGDPLDTRTIGKQIALKMGMDENEFDARCEDCEYVDDPDMVEELSEYTLVLSTSTFGECEKPIKAKNHLHAVYEATKYIHSDIADEDEELLRLENENGEVIFNFSDFAKV